MDSRRRTLSAFLACTALVGITRADPTPRLTASWQEKDARVEVFSPDGRSLVTAGGEGYRLRDAGTGRVRAVLGTTSDHVHGAAFSPDGRLLFAKVRSHRHSPVGVFDLKVWAVGTGEELRTFPYISESLNVSTEFFALDLYELGSGRRWSVPALGNGDDDPVFRPDGRLLFPSGLPRMDPHIQGAQGYYCYDLATLPPGRVELESAELAISPDGSRYAAVRGERGTGNPLTVSLQDLPSLCESGRIEVAGLVAAGFSTDGRSFGAGLPTPP